VSKTSARPTCRSTTPHPTRSGWPSFPSPATCSPEPRRCRYPGRCGWPNPRRCACGCTPSPGADPIRGGEPSYGWTGAGPGPPRSPPP
jgi:hypothetical protein